MVVECPKCNTIFDDYEHSWVCPHAHIDRNYCKEHDLFNCPFHGDNESTQPSHNPSQSQSTAE